MLDPKLATKIASRAATAAASDNISTLSKAFAGSGKLAKTQVMNWTIWKVIFTPWVACVAAADD